MRIAVLGWGSLIWCPRDLALSSMWHHGGPLLPIEFARKSQHERVTLVLVPQYETLNTAFWALSAHHELSQACENLKVREETAKRHIHYATAEVSGSYDADGPDPASADVGTGVTAWLVTRDDIDAAIWTGLPPKGFGDLNADNLASDVVNYLDGRVGDGMRRAKEYVRHTPQSIRTPVRQAIEEKLDWSPVALPNHLFELHTESD